MSFEVRPYKVLTIMGEKHSFFVPRYQRLSSWEKKHYTQFAEDILDAEEIESEEAYFIGTFILKPQDPQEKNKRYEIIDGQQRIIALSLLSAALYSILYDLLEKYKNISQDDFLMRLRVCSNGVKKFLITISKNDEKNIRFKASEYEKDDANFKKILTECHVIEENGGDQSNFNKSSMTKSFKYYKQLLEEMIKSEEPEKQIKLIEKILKRIEQVSFIIIEVPSYANACQLFASFNDRGKPLSAMDIIKNMLFDKGGRDQEDVFFERWNILSGNLRADSDKSFGTPKHSDRYLRHFYNAFYREEDDLRVSDSPVSTRELTNIYKKIVDENDKWSAQTLIATMQRKSQIYNAIIDPAEHKFLKQGNAEPKCIEIKNDEIRKKIVQTLINLNDVKGAPSNTLLLYLFSKFLKKKQFFGRESENNLKEIVDFLVKFFVRRNISQFPRTNIMDTLMDKTILQCEKNLTQDQKIISSLGVEKFMVEESKIRNRKMFATDLENFTADDPSSSKLLKIIFKKLSDFQTESQRDKNYSSVSNSCKIEHILPGTYKDKTEWIKEFNCYNRKISREESLKICGDWLHRIGNLTMTDENSTLSNAIFRFKKTEPKYGYENTQFWLDNFLFEVEENGDKKMYRLSNSPNWNKLFVEGRNKKLADHIASFYQFKSEERN